VCCGPRPNDGFDLLAELLARDAENRDILDIGYGVRTFSIPVG
jgi:hypothetical protein